MQYSKTFNTIVPWIYAADDATYELLWVRIGDTYIGALYHPPRPQYNTGVLLDYVARRVCRRSVGRENNLRLNRRKSVEILFTDGRCRRQRRVIPTPHLPEVTTLKILGATISRITRLFVPLTIHTTDYSYHL